MSCQCFTPVAAGLTTLSGTAEQTKRELSTLSPEDRAELAYYLIHSLDVGSDPDAEEAWDRELNKRLQEIKSGKEKGEPADKVFAELREKYS